MVAWRDVPDTVDVSESRFFSRVLALGQHVDGISV